MTEQVSSPLPQTDEQERAEWQAMREREAAAELAGAPHGRCKSPNYDERLPDARLGTPAYATCGAALIPAEDEGTFCVSCLWRDVQEYGSEE